MKRSWYKTSKLCTALRKHVLRVDLCVFIDEEKAFSDENYLNSTIKSILTAAIIKGLDIVGILSPKSPSIGFRAVQMAQSQQMDIVVVPGQTYICKEGTELYVYNLQQPLKPNLTFAEACRTAHSYNGFVVASNVTKRQALLLDKLQGSDSAPDAIEIFNSKIGGYRDLNIDFPKFVSSGATSATDLEATEVFTLLDRKVAEDMNLIKPEEGVNFVPKYLKPKSGGLTNGQSIL
jgi:hypothetical protein